MCASRKGLEVMTEMWKEDNTHTLLIGIEASASIREQYGDYIKVKNTSGGCCSISIPE